MSINDRTAPFYVFSDSKVQGHVVGTGEINGRMRARMRALRLLQEIDSKTVKEASKLLPSLLSFLEHEDPAVIGRSITTGTNLFSAVLAEMAQQIYNSNTISGWLEEMWSGMLQFKNAVQGMLDIRFGYEMIRNKQSTTHVRKRGRDSVGPKVLAAKFLENCFLLFTSDGSNNEEGREHKLDISRLVLNRPLLNPAMLESQARQILDCFLDILKSADTCSGTLLITTINCLAAIAKRRPVHYNTILSSLLNFGLKFEAINGGHTASIHCAVRVALLGFLRCTHSPIFESRERLLGALRSRYPGEATEQTIRQMEKISRNVNRNSRDTHLNASDKNEMHTDELCAMRTHPNASDAIYNDAQKNSVMENSEPTPAKLMLSDISSLLALGEYQSIEFLVSTLDAGLLADIVIETMNELPEITTVAGRNGSLLPSSYTELPSGNSQNRSAVLNLASDFATVERASDIPHNTASNSKRDPRRMVNNTVSNSTRDPRKVVQNIASNSKRDPRRVVQNTATNSKRDPRRMVQNTASNSKRHPRRVR